jgi:hypothetical protein
MGGVAGGVVSEIYGGNFWQGFAQGAETAAAGFLFNENMPHLLGVVCEDGFPALFDYDTNKSLPPNEYTPEEIGRHPVLDFIRDRIVKELIVEGALTIADKFGGPIVKATTMGIRIIRYTLESTELEEKKQ